jgi:hypothetical protein
MAETWFGLENIKKISHIIKEYLYLLFSLLFILWMQPLEVMNVLVLNCFGVP